MKRLLIPTALLVFAACTTAPAPTASEPPATVTPKVEAAPPPATTTAPAPDTTAAAVQTQPIPGLAAFEQLEQRLAKMDKFDVRFHIESSGPIPSVVKGEVHMKGEDVHIQTYGKLKGESKAARLPAEEDGTLPAGSRSAVLVGMTRMGLLHNLVRMLMMNEGIDMKPGSDPNWVKVDNITYDLADRHFHFDIIVEGQNAGWADLWLTPDGKPQHRKEVVHFPDGDLNVEERYLWL